MLNIYKITIICCLLLLSFNSKSQDARQLIQERMDKVNQFEQTGVKFGEDSLSKTAIIYINELKDIKAKDDVILDLINNDLEKFVRDTSETNHLLVENQRISLELEQKKGIFFYSLAISVLSTAFFLIFMVLFINARGKMKRAVDVAYMERQETAKYQSEMEEMKHQILRNAGNEVSKEEYLKLKEVSDLELAKLHDLIREKDFEFNKLKIAFKEINDLNADVNEKLLASQKEVEELGEALTNLSQVSKYKIEEMEVNFFKIEKLAKLREMNAISESEYQMKKNILMSEI